MLNSLSMSRDLSYGCTGCSLCCRKIGETIERVKNMDSKDPFIKAFQDFPYKADEDGVCEKLGEDGKCTVYEDRPLVCSIPRMFQRFYKGKETRKQHYLSEAKICNRMIRKEGLDDKFLVDESQYR